MTRLTLEKPVSEMGAYELAHNCTFIKDGETWYRDFEKEISLREYIRRVALGHNVDLPTNDDELDEDLYFYLSYDPADSIEGILGVLNMLAWSHSELRAQLSEYENIGTIEQVKTAMNSPCDISEILEILDKMEFFGGQRAGRELWADKARSAQDEDIENFNRDIHKIKGYILSARKSMEQIVERLEEHYKEEYRNAEKYKGKIAFGRYLAFKDAIKIVKEETDHEESNIISGTTSGS